MKKQLFRILTICSISVYYGLVIKVILFQKALMFRAFSLSMKETFHRTMVRVSYFARENTTADADVFSL